MIQLGRPSIGPEEIAAVQRVLLSGRLVQGSNVARFESTVAEYLGVKHAVAVSSGTAALHLALMGLGVSEGDRVIVPAYTFPATANVVEILGATPVFVDVEPASFNLDPEQVRAEVEGSSDDPSRRISCIMPVHAFGHMSEMKEIRRIAREFAIPVVEDAACALGASIDGCPPGSWGEAACLSFHPRKVITTGEGGMVVTDRDDFADHLRMLRNHGQSARDAMGDFAEAGLNYRLSEVGGAIGVAQMKKLDRFLAARAAVAATYGELLIASSVRVPSVLEGHRHAFQAFVVLLPKRGPGPPTDVIGAMRKQGVEVTVGTWNVPLAPYYRKRYGFSEGNFPVADDLLNRALALPMHPLLEEDERRQVAGRLMETLHEGAHAQ